MAGDLKHFDCAPKAGSKIFIMFKCIEIYFTYWLFSETRVFIIVYNCLLIKVWKLKVYGICNSISYICKVIVI